MAVFQAGAVEGTLTIDRSPFTRGLQAARKQADQFARRKLAPVVDLDTRRAEAQLKKLQGQLDGLADPKVTPDLDTTRYDREKTDFDRKTKRPTSAPVTVTLDPNGRARLEYVRLQLDQLAARVTEARVRPDVDKAGDAKLSAVEATMLRLGAQVARPKVNLGGVAGAEAQLFALNAQLDKLGAKDERPKVDPDTKSADVSIGHLGGQVGILRLGLLAIAPAAVPAFAVIAAGAIAAAGPLAAVTAGLGALAIVGVPSIKKLTDANTKLAAAQAKVDQATTPAQRNAALLQQKAILAQLSPVQLVALKNLSALQDKYHALQAQLAGPIFGLFNQGLKVANDLLPTLGVLITGITPSLSQLLTALDKGVSSAGFTSFVTFLGRQAGPAILSFGKFLGGLAVGFAGVLRAFAPLYPKLDSGLAGIGAAAAKAGTNLGSSSGLRKFLDYVIVNGPLLGQLLLNVARSVGNLASGLAPLGHLSLVGLNGLFATISKIPPQQLGLIAAGLLGVAAGMKAIGATQAAFTGLKSVLGKGGILSFLGLAADTGPVGLIILGIVAAIAALAAGFIYLYTQSKPVRDVVAQIGGVFSALWAKAEPILKGDFQQAMLGVHSAVQQISKAIQDNRPEINELLNVFEKIGTYLIVHLLPLLGPGLRGAFLIIGGSINATIRLIGILVDTFTFFAKVAVNSVGLVLDVLSALVNAGAKIPGALGAPFRAAKKAIDSAHASLEKTKATLDSFHNRSITVTARGVIIAEGKIYGAQAARVRAQDPVDRMKNAAGGYIRGPGTATSDSIPASLSNGEYVIRAAAVRKVGVDNLDRINRQGFANGGLAGSLPQGVNAFNAQTNSILAGLVSKQLQALLAAQAREAARVAGASAGGAARWSTDVELVLQQLGQPASLLGAVLRRINFESGGNPNAINRTDSNARAGHPSQGLMQTIPSTFAAYAGPYRSLGILNPLANIYAGLNYALHRYGSIAAIDPLVRPEGYDKGGVATGPGMLPKRTPKPERVLSPDQTAAFERLVDSLTADGTASVRLHPDDLAAMARHDNTFNFGSTEMVEASVRHAIQLAEMTGRQQIGRPR